jgi:hypothetical protein
MMRHTPLHRTRIFRPLRAGLWLLLTGLALLPAAPAARADHGPKPSQEFKFVYQTAQPVPIWGGQLLDCADAGCAATKPVQNRPAAYFLCSTDSCNATSATGYADYQKLIIRFADKTRESAPFTHRDNGDFRNAFVVTVRDNDLLVAEEASVYAFVSPFQVLLFFPALIFTLVVELAVAAIYLKATQRLNRRILLWIVAANILSVPVVWFVLPLLHRSWGLDAPMIIVLSELFAFVFEAGFLYLTNRDLLTARHVLILSLLMNAGSFFLGLCSSGIA